MKKKFFAIITMLALTIAFAVPAFAATGISAAEQKLLDEFKAGYTVDGVTVVPPAKYVSAAEKALAEKDFSASEIAKLRSTMQSVYAELQSNKLTTAADIKAYSGYNALVKKIQATTESVGYKATVGGTVTAIGGAGRTKQTGFDMSATIVVALASIAVLGAGAVVIGKKELIAE